MQYYSEEKKFCVLQKKVLSFGPNGTVEVRPNSSAEPNIWSVTTPYEPPHEPGHKGQIKGYKIF